jgi:hypothetical protein
MSDTKISLKQGKMSNLSSTSLSSGQILFAVNDSADSGTIYLDYTNEGGTTNRVKMDMGAFPANKIHYGENPPSSPEEGLIWLSPEAIENNLIYYGESAPTSPEEGMVWLRPEDDEAYITPIEEGGTNATTASGARTNLDIYSKGEVDSAVSNSQTTVLNQVYNKTEVDNLLANLDVSLPITYGTTDLTPMVSPLAQGAIYLVYE